MSYSENLLKHVQWYTRRGLRVFPCSPKAKVPATAHGCKDASTAPGQIAAWWDGIHLYNVGIATGSGLVVLDVDVNHSAGKYGDETLADLERQYGPLPDTWTCLTGGGGVHYYFQCDDPALTVGTGFAPGLDYRGAGGNLVAPPSTHENGREYVWEAAHTPHNAPLAPLPEWLHMLMLNGSKPGPMTQGDASEKVPEGKRNQELFKLAASLRSKGLTVEEITATLLEANKGRCSPPLPDSEIKAICNSAGRYDRGKPKDQADRPQPSIVKASQVPYEPPRWTIAPYIQRGKGTLIQADNGTGKTAFVCAIAAHVSTGRELLDIPVETPGNVLLLSVEDDLPVLRGRIEASGGDLDKCHFLTNAAGLSFNSPEVEEAVKQVQARLVIFDPLQAFMGAKVDMFRANETRPELAKLFEMCDRNDCACIIIAHTAKSIGDRSPVNRALGSVDIPAAMRSVLQIIENPDNEYERIAVHVKCSNAPKGQSIVYTIGDRGGVQWIGFSPMTADDLTAVVKRKEKGIPYENEPLVQVFNQLVTDRPGGGFWSYADLKSEGAKILGFPPFGSTNELREKLDSGLARELQVNDGLIVTHSKRGAHNIHGIRIEQYRLPQGYQTKIANG